VSAVILAVIVIMWAVVLVPMWLRRHDAATESRSVDRFSAAMRVLSRRQPAAAGTARYVLMPRRDSAASVHVSGAAAIPPLPVAPRRAAAPAAPRRKASLAVRRRRVLLGVLGAAFLTTVLVVGGVIGWVLPIVVDLLAVAFVVHLRTQARRSAALARQRRRAAAAPAPVAAPVAAEPVTPTAARYAARVAQSAASEPEVEAAPAEYVAIDEPAAAVSVAAEATGTDDASAWEPVPVPRPTYTMKPAAPPRRYPPVQPDSDELPVADEMPVGDETVAAQGETQSAADDDGQLDEILTHRWAVND
jgi:uncharacterized membrane protein